MRWLEWGKYTICSKPKIPLSNNKSTSSKNEHHTLWDNPWHEWKVIGEWLQINLLWNTLKIILQSIWVLQCNSPLKDKEVEKCSDFSLDQGWSNFCSKESNFSYNDSNCILKKVVAISVYLPSCSSQDECWLSPTAEIYFSSDQGLYSRNWFYFAGIASASQLFEAS